MDPFFLFSLVLYCLFLAEDFMVLFLGFSLKMSYTNLMLSMFIYS